MITVYFLKRSAKNCTKHVEFGLAVPEVNAGTRVQAKCLSFISYVFFLQTTSNKAEVDDLMNALENKDVKLRSVEGKVSIILSYEPL